MEEDWRLAAEQLTIWLSYVELFLFQGVLHQN